MRVPPLKIHWHQYPFLFPTIAVIAGIVFYFYKVPLIYNFRFASVALAILICLFLLLHVSRTLNKSIQYLRSFLIFLVFMLIGNLIAFFKDPFNQRYWYGNQLSQIQALQLRLQENPAPKTKIVRLETQVVAVQIGNQWVPAKGLIDLNLYKNDSIPALKIGDQMVIENQLVPIFNSGNPFSFRQGDYAQLKGKYHQAFLDYKKVHFMPAELEEISWIGRSRNRILQIIHDNVEDKTTAGLVAAVIVNERTDMDKDLWDDYSRTGIAHIVAISGMHITLFFIILGYMIFFIRHKKYDWIKYALIVPIAWIYIMITGFPPSAVRAAIMFTILSVGIFLKRDAPPVNVLLATAFILLLFEPFWIFDVGFQLSFLSVLSIFIFYKPIAELWKIHNRYLNAIWQTAAVSMAVQVLLFPLLIYYFHQFPIWSVIANIPAAAYSFIFMVLSLLLILLGFVGIKAVWVGDIIHWLTDLFHIIIRKLSDWSPDPLFRLYIDVKEFWLMTAAVLLLVLFLISRNKKMLIAFSMTAISLLSFFIIDTLQKNKQHILIVYNINNKTLIEEIKGREAVAMHCELFEVKDEQYSVKPAHIGFGIKHSKMEPLKNQVFHLHGKNLLLLNQRFYLKSQEFFKVDYLMITKNVAFNPTLWKQVFSPELIIIDGSIKRYKAKKYKQQLETEGFKVHWVLEDGALVIKS